MWKMYNELIDAIPEDLTVLECMIGASWTLVRSERGTGIAKTIKGGKKGAELSRVRGMPLKELASYSKSWNMLEASLGQAAVNAAYNTPSELLAITGKPVLKSDSQKSNAFKHVEPEIKGKKVAIIGHFPDIEHFNDLCQLSILEREPREDDYPDSACEYILPEQDFVFITGTAFTNKTMPRLLELSKKAKTILVGPSVPITRILFNYGVDQIAGLVALEQELIWEAAKEGKKMSIFKHGGEMVNIQR
ncbi:DUF364 domain-containing protein [Dehalobacter sp. DCM]|uniref:DUF364 domain-containing protein n=1 Tax=Dehalobacter sp. DCM TaxID=2907827 RepID=UPI0030818DCC|nr:DUF364 domain-containing protein [Dehalobacter sp. DCM]